jgi:hypothetical protein
VRVGVVAGDLLTPSGRRGTVMIDAIIVIATLLVTLGGFALLAIRSLANDTLKNADISGEREREPDRVCSSAREFDQDCTGEDAINDDVDEQGSDSFTVFSVAQAFDRDCAIIWSTQLSALRLLDRAGRKGLAVKLMYPFYARAVRRYPELYDGSTFGSWLEFLERERLLKRSGLQVFITADGHEFLEYGLASESIPAA